MPNVVIVISIRGRTVMRSSLIPRACVCIQLHLSEFVGIGLMEL